MFKRILNTIRGVIALILFIANILVLSFFVLFFGFFAWVVPIRAWRHNGMKLVSIIPLIWMDINRLIMTFCARKKLDIQGTKHLDPNGWYLLVSNHQSWLDIIVIGAVFNHKIPILKFFMKKELLWQLPIAGLACYFLGYPFLHRHSKSEIRKNPELKGKDIEIARRACDKFKELPTTIINFVEGTRFTTEKHQRQKSPYKNLLKPKAAGIAIVLEEMHKHLQGIINLTVQYQPKTVSMWEFVCGDFDKIIIRYEVLPVTEDLVGDYYGDRDFRIKLQQWLNDTWETKDLLLEELQKSEQQK